MKLLKQEGPHCLIYAVAMVLDLAPEEVIQRLGHDGTEVWWDEVAAPFNCRGVHIQECLDVAHDLGLTLMHIDALPYQRPNPQTEARPLWEPEGAIARFERYLSLYNAILVGERVRMDGTSGGHAVAWDKHMIYDPIGEVYDLGNPKLMIREAWLVVV